MGYTARVGTPAAGGGGTARRTAIVLAAAAAVAALVGVRGDFPLSDDWSYAYTTRALCREGRLVFLPWVGASLVLQAWYGAALCALLGFSFEVLRASTLVLAAAGAVVFTLLVARLGARGRVLAVTVAALALNPLWVSLSFTFMTDVPCTVAAIGAAYAYARGLGERRLGLVVVGSVLAAAALLIRQHGILVAAAAALAALAAGDRPLAARLRAAAAATALPVAAFVALHVWLLGHSGLPAGYAQKVGEAAGFTVASVVNCAFRGVMYLGLFTAPLLVGVRHPLDAWHPRLMRAALAAVVMLATALWLREGALMFYLTNVLSDLGVGPLTLRDTQFLALGPVVQAGLALTLPLTAVAALGAARLAATWLIGLGRWREPVPAFLLAATALTFAGTLLHARYYFDRYLLLVLPFALALIAVVRPLPAARPRPVVLALLLALYGVAGTHDYLAWNRARFAALAALEAAGVPPAAIDGGVEYNAWRLAAALGTWPSDAEARPGQPPDRRSWWWVVDDRFVLSFRPLAGYTVRRDLAYRRWLPPGTGHVFVLERAVPAAR